MNQGIIKSIESFFKNEDKKEKIMTNLKTGDVAPDFEALNEKGETVKLADFAGKKLILFFYPADDTPGCTAAACSLRDHYAELQKRGFEMLGVSPDTVKKHGKFITKHAFPFSLIADENQTVMNAYGVWGEKKFMGRTFDGVLRTTFVIDENGNIEHVVTKVDTKNHAEQLLELYENAPK
ncbi:MAG: hypothetical protein RL757_431 [Bacteroidota bacterium]